MIIIKADNRSILKDAKFSYLSTNYASGVTTLVLDNVNGFSADDYILIGEFGSETSEIIQIGTVTGATNTIVIKSAGVTSCSHSESTKAYLIPYNQVKFYWTATATFATTTPLATYGLQCDDYFTKYIDNSNTTGFGWFVFYNATSALTSTNSNAIPYGGFADNSAKNIIDSFFSALNNKESSLITHTDAFKYLSEAHSRAQNNLNLVNDEYTTQLKYTITITGGVKEYALPSDFSDLVAITDPRGVNIEFCNTWKIMPYDAVPSNAIKYYLRGRNIGFTPTPQNDDTAYVYYKAKSTSISSLYDTLDYPDNNFYPLLDFMMYRACPKLGRSRQEAESYLSAFNNGVELMKVTSIKQSSNLDAWDVDPTANV